MLSEFTVLLEYWPDILNGIWLTLLIWVTSMFFGMLLGLGLSMIQLKSFWLGTLLVKSLNTVMRGTPFLILLFIVYYGGPYIGLVLDPLPAGIISLSVYSSSYFCEIFRSGFLSIPKGQIEAANIFGFSKLKILFHVSLPQMMIVIFPSLVNMTIILVKETSIVSVISVSELTATLSSIGTLTFAYVPTLAFLALFYWILLEALSFWATRVEAKLSHYLIK